jgi:hypothetical protein
MLYDRDPATGVVKLVTRDSEVILTVLDDPVAGFRMKLLCAREVRILFIIVREQAGSVVL